MGNEFLLLETFRLNLPPMQFSFPLRNFISSQCCCFSMIFDLAVSTLIKNKSRKRVVTYVVVFVGAIFC